MTANHEQPAEAIRATTREREQAVQALYAAVGDGSLPLADLDERVGAAHAATHRRDLHPLLADLPASHERREGVAAWKEHWSTTVALLRGTWLGTPAAESVTERQAGMAALLTLLAVVWLLAWTVVGLGIVVVG